MTHTTNLTAKLNEYSSNGNWDIVDLDHNIVGKAYGAPWNPAQDAKANARLWTAAGDLLSACEFNGGEFSYDDGPDMLERLADVLENYVGWTGGWVHGLRAKAEVERAAITKARGES